ncbi:MAG: hypothetical protein ABF289_01910 [Clostridiales bacterium]
MINKTYITLIVLVAFSLLLYGCNVLSATEKYLRAIRSTSNLKSFESTEAFKISFDLGKASAKDKKKLKDFKDISINKDLKYSNGNIVENVFFNTESITVDNTIYIFGKKSYLKSTLFNDKYIDLNKIYSDNDIDKNKKLNEDLMKIWANSVEKEIMEEEGSSIITTPDGDIKVKQVSLSLNNEKAKIILGDLANLIENNSNIKDIILKTFKEYNDEKSKVDENKINGWLDNLKDNFESNKKKFEINKLNLTAKYDKDNYIIEQNIKGTIILKNKGIVKVNFTYDKKYWNINKKIDIKIPKIKDSDLWISKR